MHRTRQAAAEIALHELSQLDAGRRPCGAQLLKPGRGCIDLDQNVEGNKSKPFRCKLASFYPQKKQRAFSQSDHPEVDAGHADWGVILSFIYCGSMIALKTGQMAIRIGRRQFISALGGATVAWPLAAHAQPRATPVVGFLSILSSRYIASRMPSFRQGLKEGGYIEGQNVAIEYRLAEGHYDRLPDLAADLVGRHAAAIVTAGIDPTKVAKAATATLPIVFLSDVDPVNAGIVTSLNRPGGNITGISLLGSALEAKRLELLNEIVSGTAPIGVLLDPRFPDANLELRELQDAASAIKRRIIVERVGNGPEIDAAFATVAQRGASALLVAQNAFFGNVIDQLAALAARYKLPTMYAQREFAEAGGFVSYGADFAEGYRQAGLYVAKILKGIKPADLPVVQPTKFQLVINRKTAKALGFDIPAKLLAIADEVIE